MLYTSFVVQFSRTVSPSAFSRRLCYFTTSGALCQDLFENFFRFFLRPAPRPPSWSPSHNSFDILSPFSTFVKGFSGENAKNPEFRFFRQKNRDLGRISLKKPGQTTWLFKTSESCSGLPAELIAEAPRLLQSEKARALPAGGPSRARTLDQPVMSR